MNRRARAAGIATVGVAHGTVSGCVTEHGVPMAGLDHEFTTTALFSAEASAFLLGHIHKHQLWREGNRLVAYPGSIGRLHYGEEGDKGFILWTVDADGASLEFVPTPARRMVHLDFGGPPDLAAIQAAAASAQGAFVRVRWNVAEEERESVDRAAIVAALAGAAEVKLEARVIPVLRSRAEGISGAQSLEQKLRRWAETTGVEVEGLAARLKELQSSEVEEIVRRVSDDDRDLLAAESQPSPQHDPHDEAIAAPAIVPGTVAVRKRWQMIPETLYLKGFAGIRAGLNRDELSLDLVQLAGDARARGVRRPQRRRQDHGDGQPAALSAAALAGVELWSRRILLLRAPGAAGVRQGTRLAACGRALPLHPGLSHERQTQDRGVSARRGKRPVGPGEASRRHGE